MPDLPSIAARGTPDPVAEATVQPEAAATPGPWRWVDGAMVADAVGDERDFDVNWSVEPPLPCSPTRIIETDSGFYPPREPDALFIAHARTDIPFLLAELSRLSAAVDTERERALRWAFDDANPDAARHYSDVDGLRHLYVARGLAALEGES